MAIDTLERFAVGDVVALAHDLPSRSKQLKAGARGLVVCTGFAWGAVSVRLGQDPDRGPLYLLPARHLALIARAPAEVPA